MTRSERERLKRSIEELDRLAETLSNWGRTAPPGENFAPAMAASVVANEARFLFGLLMDARPEPESLPYTLERDDHV